MKFCGIKATIAVISPIAIVALFFCFTRVEGQSVNFFTGMPSNEAQGCLLNSDNSSILKITDPVAILIANDNNVYGITGNYNVNFDCGDATSSSCANIKKAFATISGPTIAECRQYSSGDNWAKRQSSQYRSRPFP